MMNTFTPTRRRFRFACSDLKEDVRWSLGVPHIILHLFYLCENVSGFCSTKPQGTVRTSPMLWFAGSSVFGLMSVSFIGLLFEFVSETLLSVNSKINTT